MGKQLVSDTINRSFWLKGLSLIPRNNWGNVFFKAFLEKWLWEDSCFTTVASKRVFRTSQSQYAFLNSLEESA